MRRCSAPLWLALAVLLMPIGAHAAAIDWADGIATLANPGADLGSASYSTWSVEGQRITVRFLLPVADAQRLAGTDIEVLVQQRVGEYLLGHLAVRAGSAFCEAIDQGYDIGRVDPLTVAAGLYGFEIFFQCAPLGVTASSAGPAAPGEPLSAAEPTSPAGLVLEDHALFDRLPGQVDFARVQEADGAFRMQLFTATHQQLALPTASAPPAAGWQRYAALGFVRMLARWDRLCFLLGAVLLTRGVRELRVLGLSLAAGYALSLIATVPGDLVPRGGLLGAAVGLLVALVAGQQIVRELARARPAILAAMGTLLALAALSWLAHATWPVLLLAGAALLVGGVLGARASLANWGQGAALLTALFGFLDGFVLPEAVGPQQVSASALLPMAAGYDFGALLAAVAVMALLMLARRALSRWVHEPRSRVPWALARDSATALLAGLGVFWMLSRLHG
ncbi:MAG TPA: hypothetical protein VHY19_15265 [Steroidobacteraceae bacterium]|jgi:hypothetical protein|nr:hypothetical protein [Steroidobacteraceae bacterium]